MVNQQMSWRRVFIIVLLIFAQIILNNMFVLGPFVYITLIPLVIMTLPLEQNNIVSLLIAFGIGLIVDIATLDTIGLNAGAAVLACILRIPIARLCFNIADKAYTPTISEAGIFKHSEYLFGLTLVYFCFYTTFDGFYSHGFLPFIARIIISGVISVIISLILDLMVLNTK